MAPDILSTVIEVERELQRRFDEEKKLCRERIEKAAAEAERELAVEERRLADAEEASLSSARSAAEQEAAGIREAAKRRAATIDGIPEDILRRAVRKYLVRILPESRS